MSPRPYTPSPKYRPASFLAAIALPVLGAALVPQTAAAGPFFYKFNIVADSQPGFPWTAVFPVPAINGSGRVAFGARLTGGVEGIFTRLGTGGINTLADTGVGPYDSFGLTVSINSLDTVLLAGLEIQDPVVVTLLRGQGNSASALVSTSSALDGFCAAQINNKSTVAYRATRADGKHVILARGEGPLTGVVRTIATEGEGGFSQLHCTPAIAHDGRVAFTATQFSWPGVFTRAEDGTLTRVAGSGDQFATFRDVAINQFGGVAWTGINNGYGETLNRVNNGLLTRVAGAQQLNGGHFAGFSINESGQVAYEVTHGANGSELRLGPNSVFGRVLGIGDLLFGRVVFVTQVGRDGLNSSGHVAARVGFLGGGDMIVRGQPVRVFDDILADIGGFVLTASNGGALDVGTTVPPIATNTTLSFNLMFLSPQGALVVKLGDTVLAHLPASEIGVRKRVTIPIDPRVVKGADWLQFSMAGKEVSSVQLSDLLIQDAFKDPLDSLDRWKVKKSGLAMATVVSTTRYPVKLSLTGDPKSVVTAAVLSNEDFDSTTDVLPATLRLSGGAVRVTRDRSGAEVFACVGKDLNGDGLADLVCEVDMKNAVVQPKQPLQLEAMTPYGWGIAGADAVRTSMRTRE